MNSPTSPATPTGEAQAQYRKKPVVITATQWFKNGDHPNDYATDSQGFENGELRAFTGAECKARGWEGAVVRYFRRPDVDGAHECMYCNSTMHCHGWIDTREGGHIVCPGDFIITGVAGERYPCKAAIFAATYEPVTDQTPSPAPSPTVVLSDGEIKNIIHQAMYFRDMDASNPEMGVVPTYAHYILSALRMNGVSVGASSPSASAEAGEFAVRRVLAFCGTCPDSEGLPYSYYWGGELVSAKSTVITFGDLRTVAAQAKALARVTAERDEARAALRLTTAALKELRAATVNWSKDIGHPNNRANDAMAWRVNRAIDAADQLSAPEVQL